MIIDFHTHTFPDKIAGRALTKLSHNSHSKPFTDGTDTGLVRSMKESGIDLSVILPVATDPAQVMGINDSAARREEERLAEGLISFGAMHPDYEDWHGELARIRENGMKGIKIHPVYQETDLDDIRLLRIYDRCAELGLSVVIHAGFDIGMRFANCAQGSGITASALSLRIWADGGSGIRCSDSHRNSQRPAL